MRWYGGGWLMCVRSSPSNLAFSLDGHVDDEVDGIFVGSLVLLTFGDNDNGVVSSKVGGIVDLDLAHALSSFCCLVSALYVTCVLKSSRSSYDTISSSISSSSWTNNS